PQPSWGFSVHKKRQGYLSCRLSFMR
ncbi:TPA: IS200/IS605 family transposase, partial [Escherichia coli]